MTPKSIHIIGAGVAGLACAAEVVRRGRTAHVYEATKHAGGRCRSFHDTTLDLTLDNGSHVVLGGNPSVFKFLKAIGSDKPLVLADQTGAIPFFNAATGETWTVRPNAGPLPWWVLSSRRRPPHTRARDFTCVTKLIRADSSATVAEVLDQYSTAWHKFWYPLCTAVMNTAPDMASARLFGTAVRHALFSFRGGMEPYVPKTCLGDAFIAPAATHLARAGCPIRFASPLVDIAGQTDAEFLRFRSHRVSLNKGDRVVLALPPWSPVVRRFYPSSFSPKPSPIVNVHYTMDTWPRSLGSAMTGIVSGAGHWVFVRENVVSVTVSADDTLIQHNQDEIASLLWQDVQKVFARPEPSVPPNRVIVERRATPVQDPIFARNRPATRTQWRNVFLAGDWIDTGLPCTLESAVLSGFKAAAAALQAP